MNRNTIIRSESPVARGYETRQVRCVTLNFSLEFRRDKIKLQYFLHEWYSTVLHIMRRRRVYNAIHSV